MVAARMSPFSGKVGWAEQEAHPSTPPTNEYESAPETPARTQKSLEYTKRPLGTPPVTELKPAGNSQQIRLKSRASSLIQKYAGHSWREAQRTKWMLDVVMHIDMDYRTYIHEQATEIETLHQQLQQTQDTNAHAMQEVHGQNHKLLTHVRQLEEQLRAANQSVLDMQNRIATCETAMNSAQAAASVAAEECQQLQQAVSILAEHDAATRKQLANRTHVMKSALLQSQSKVRQGTEQQRRHNMEVTSILKLRDAQAASAREAQHATVRAQLAAQAVVERASARLEVERVKMELDAYKEPWTYLYGNKSPTRDPKKAAELQLQTSSMKGMVPY